MAWATVYIQGRTDFQIAVISKLEGLWLLGSPEVKDELVMYWLPDTLVLRRLKEAIGSKLIFKYRLRFITNLNDHLQDDHEPSDEFSFSEHALVNKMLQYDKTQRNHKIDNEIQV